MQKTLRIHRVLHRVLALSITGALFAMGATGAQAQAVTQGTAPAAAAAAGAPAAPAAPRASTAKLDRSDRNALTEMAEANMAEIATGKLALSKAVNPEIKAYAQRMVDEHSKTLAEVQALAQAKGVEMPKELSVKHKAKGAMLKALSGDAFDRAYMNNSGRQDHHATHDQLRDNMNKIKDPDIKALAMKMQPIVEQHLLAAEELIARTARGATGTSGTPGNDTSTITGKEPIPNKK